MQALRIQHVTTFQHGNAATASWQMLRLQPRAEAEQELVSFDLEVSPGQRDLTARADVFGNIVHRFSTKAAAEAVRIQAVSRVRRSVPAVLEVRRSCPVMEVGERALAEVNSTDPTLEQFRYGSPRVELLAEAYELASGLDRSMPVLEWLSSLGGYFGERFTFDPTSTSVTTPLEQVLEQRRGVCQDFSHLFISCLRQHGIPAGYVSGYLLTQPPPGRERLIGADAMHAWIMAWVPEYGWVDYDPTNHCFVRDSHVVVARGRDYDDVSPIRGIFRGGSRHVQTLGVTVELESL